MSRVWTGAARALLGLTLLLAFLALAASSEAVSAESKEAPKSFEVPYRLTVPKHLLVRAKINGKGPFNFILDTGAPALFVAVPVCKKLGIKADENGWGTFDRFEIEGGVVLTKARGRVETPFQLEGMNGMGLAGAEVHGLIGYNILARYRMTVDFTHDKLIWTPLDYKPVAPAGMGGKVQGGAGGLEMMGSMMKMLGGFLGAKANPETTLRGFLGLTLVDEGKEYPSVTAVLEHGPAARAGVKPGDKLLKVQGRTITNIADVNQRLEKVAPGEKITLTVERAKETKEITFTVGEGI